MAGKYVFVLKIGHWVAKMGDLEVEVCGDPLRRLALLSHFKELKSEGDYSRKYAQCLVSVPLAPGMLASLMKSWGKTWGTIPH